MNFDAKIGDFLLCYWRTFRIEIDTFLTHINLLAALMVHNPLGDMLLHNQKYFHEHKGKPRT